MERAELKDPVFRNAERDRKNNKRQEMFLHKCFNSAMKKNGLGQS